MKINTRILSIIISIVLIMIWFAAGLASSFPYLSAFMEKWLLFSPFSGSLIYWIELFVILDLLWVFRFRSTQILYSSLFLTILGAVVAIFKMPDFSEMLLRLSLVGWLTGSILTLIENYRKKPPKKVSDG